MSDEMTNVETQPHNVEANTCPVCGRDVPPNTHGGIPRRYCTPEHRWLAGSRRRAGIPVDRQPFNTPRIVSRGPLTAYARTTGQALDRAINQVERILADERLPAHRDQVGDALRVYLGHAETVSRDALNQLDHHHPGETP